MKCRIVRLASLGCTGLALLAVPSGCQGSNGPEPVAESSSESEDTSTRLLGGMHGIMQSKLVHAHAVLEAISLENYKRIERHADALESLSRESDWNVHSTMAYGVFSDEFRVVCRTLADHARERNREAVSRDYVMLVESCLNCHNYLRREGLTRDAPGRVTWVDSLPELAAPEDPG
jgi:hypothetical protein